MAGDGVTTNNYAAAAAATARIRPTSSSINRHSPLPSQPYQIYKQEGWLSPTERASVSAISLRYIIWLPRESHAGMSLPTADLQVQTFWPPLSSPWVYRGKYYMDGKRIQCLSNASQHIPSIFNRFPVIQDFKP